MVLFSAKCFIEVITEAGSVILADQLPGPCGLQRRQCAWHQYECMGGLRVCMDVSEQILEDKRTQNLPGTCNSRA